MSEHTPGPWIVAPGVPSAVDRASGGLVAEATGDASYEQQCADARLIAAAPDLLEALKAAHHRMTAIGCRYGHDNDFTAVCDAIARAKGERVP